MKTKYKQQVNEIKIILFSITMALIIGGIVIAIDGKNPFLAYSALVQNSVASKYAISTTLAKSVPLIVTGLATAIAFKSGIFNIGGEGQLYIGAFCSAYIGFTFVNLPPYVGIPLAFLAGIIGGALFALIPALLKVYYNIDEVITTIMFNSIGILLTSYLVAYPFKSTDSNLNATNKMAEQFQLSSIVSGTKLNTSFYFTILIFFLIYYVLRKTTFGYNLTLVGKNNLFAKYGGINDKKIMIIAMLISGGLCGLAGAFEVYGTHKRFLANISNELAFDGMLIALIVKNNPIGIVFVSLFFAILKTGALGMELQTSVPSEIILIIQSIIILFIAGQDGFKEIYNKYKSRKEA